MDLQVIANLDKLLDAYKGGAPINQRIEQASTVSHPAIASLIEPFTERELEVLQLIAQGSSERAVAEQLIVVVGTVKRHLNNL